MQNPNPGPNLPWPLLWKLKVPARIKFFTWQLVNNILPNAIFLAQRKIIDSNSCPLCHQKPETTHHFWFLNATTSQA